MRLVRVEALEGGRVILVADADSRGRDGQVVSLQGMRVRTTPRASLGSRLIVLDSPVHQRLPPPSCCHHPLSSPKVCPERRRHVHGRATPGVLATARAAPASPMSAPVPRPTRCAGARLLLRRLRRQAGGRPPVPSRRGHSAARGARGAQARRRRRRDRHQGRDHPVSEQTRTIAAASAWVSPAPAPEQPPEQPPDSNHATRFTQAAD